MFELVIDADPEALLGTAGLVGEPAHPLGDQVEGQVVVAGLQVLGREPDPEILAEIGRRCGAPPMRPAARLPKPRLE